MTIALGVLAEMVGGELVGDASLVIHSARPLAAAGAGCITFVEDQKHAKEAAHSKAAALIAKPGFPVNGLAAILVGEPLLAFAAIFQHLHGPQEPLAGGIDLRADIHPSVQIGAGAAVSPFVSIGAGTVIGDRCRFYAGVSIGRNCRVGDDVVLYPNVVIYDGCTIGSRVMVHANSVIGSDGFGYRQRDGKHVKVPQLGAVVVEDDVEIGACTTIDRSTFQTTRIGAGTKIDNLVQIGHNCRIGKHNLFVGQVGIAGSTTTGDYVVIAGQAGLVDHIHIGDRAVIGAQAGVTKDVPAGQCVLGSPARPEREVKVMVLCAEKLPEMRKDLRLIKQKLGLE